MKTLKALFLYFAVLGAFLYFENAHAANYVFELGGRRSYVNYVLPASISMNSNLGVVYDVGLMYKFNETQDLSFRYKTSKYHMDLPTGITGPDKVKETQYDLVYAHKFANFRPYIGLGSNEASFLHIETNILDVQKLSSTYAKVGLEIIGVAAGWANTMVGVEVLALSSFYKFTTFGKLKLQEGSLFVEILGGYSQATLDKNSQKQRYNEMSLGLNIGKSF